MQRYDGWEGERLKTDMEERRSATVDQAMACARVPQIITALFISLDDNTVSRLVYIKSRDRRLGRQKSVAIPTDGLEFIHNKTELWVNEPGKNSGLHDVDHREDDEAFRAYIDRLNPDVKIKDTVAMKVWKNRRSWLNNDVAQAYRFAQKTKRPSYPLVVLLPHTHCPLGPQNVVYVAHTVRIVSNVTVIDSAVHAAPSLWCRDQSHCDTSPTPTAPTIDAAVCQQYHH